MHLSNQAKFFLASAVLFCSSCGFWQTAENTNTAPFIADEIKNGIPFKTKEPDRFQTEIIVTNYLNSEKNEKKYLLARDGVRRLIVFNQDDKGKTAVLQTEDGGIFFIDHEQKSYRPGQAPTLQINTELDEFLTVEWLNQKSDAAVENLGTENGLTQYRFQIAGSSSSEIVIFIDESLQVPVKQEFYSMTGEQKKLTLSVELRNFLLSADENLFKLPQDYKKIEKK